MGTDIHPAIEVLEYPEASWWRLAAIPPRERNYELFGLLAGARGDHKPWIEPRGLPSHTAHDSFHEHMDVLGMTMHREWHGVVDGDHTASWFTLAEARTFVLPDDVREDTRLLWARWLAYMAFVAADYGVSDEHVRVVFNFDS